LQLRSDSQRHIFRKKYKFLHMGFHPVLSPSPLEKTFGFVASQHQNATAGGFYGPADTDGDDYDNLPPFWLSPPEWSLLRSAEDNPIEYTLADRDDAVSYLRLLLKMLDQATSGSGNAGSSSDLPPGANRDSTELTLDSPPLKEDEAFDWYNRSTKRQKSMVVSQYCVDKIYEIIGVSLDNNAGSHSCSSPRNGAPGSSRIPSVSELFHGRDDWGEDDLHGQKSLSHPPSASTVHLQDDEWKPLLELLHNRSIDEYTKRGSALILAYVVKTGCERNEQHASQIASSTKRRNKQNMNTSDDDDLLNLFSDEHKSSTSTSAASPAGYEWTTVLNHTNFQNCIDETLSSFVSWLTSRLQCSSNYASLSVVTPTLGVLLSGTKRARDSFAKAGGIGYLVRHLTTKRRQRPAVDGGSVFRRSLDNSQPASAPRPFLIPKPSSSPPPTQNRRIISNRSIDAIPGSPSRNRGNIRSRRSSSANGSIEMLSQSNSFSSPNSPTDPNSLSGPFSNPSSNMIESVMDSVDKTLGADTTASLQSMIATAGEALSNPSVLAANGVVRQALSSSTTTTTTTPLSFQRQASASVQQVYDLVFCLWCMSLDCPSDENLRERFARDGTVSALAHLLKTAPREKVLRLTLACLRSLATLGSNEDTSDGSNGYERTSFVRDMIGCGIPKSLETVRLRRWNDSDLEDDLEFLQELLSERTAEWSQWKVYEARIGAGILRWDDLLHKADFFRANAIRMEQGDFALVKRLLAILYQNTPSGALRSRGRPVYYDGLREVGEASWDDDEDDCSGDDEVCESLAVCLFDLGEFVRHYPNGRSVAKRLGAKALVMEYANHPRFEIQEQALLCASKLLMRNWKAIGE